MLRGTFLYYEDALRKETSFSVSVGVTNISQVNSLKDSEVEGIFRATKEYVDFCLVKTEGAPYISRLVLRPLNGTEYLQNFSSNVLKVVRRINLGGKDGDIIQ